MQSVSPRRQPDVPTGDRGSVDRGLDHKSVLLHRADLLMQAERYGEAVRDLRTVQSRDPFDPQLMQLMQRLRAAPPR